MNIYKNQSIDFECENQNTHLNNCINSNNLDEKNLSISLSTSIIEYDNPEKNLNLLKEKIREINDNFAVVHPLKKMEDFEELNIGFTEQIIIHIFVHVDDKLLFFNFIIKDLLTLI